MPLWHWSPMHVLSLPQAKQGLRSCREGAHAAAAETAGIATKPRVQGRHLKIEGAADESQHACLNCPSPHLLLPATASCDFPHAATQPALPPQGRPAPTRSCPVSCFSSSLSRECRSCPSRWYTHLPAAGGGSRPPLLAPTLPGRCNGGVCRAANDCRLGSKLGSRCPAPHAPLAPLAAPPAPGAQS